MVKQGLGRGDAELVVSAATPEQFPVNTLPEVAFLGRSNVGKSTLLNCLAGRTGLAFTSSTPGRTQSINFYRVEDSYYFVDLPGYGYARVPQQVQAQWKDLIESYLVNRKALELCCLVIDSRRGWMDKDLELKHWLEFHKRRYVVIASKIDKLKTQKEHHHGMQALRSQDCEELIPFSAIQCRGAREIWQAISKIKTRQ